MKKWVILSILLTVAVLAFVIVSAARQNTFLPRVEDKSLQEASSFGTVREEAETKEDLGKGSTYFKVTGPVVDLDNKEAK